jgi:HD domain
MEDATSASARLGGRREVLAIHAGLCLAFVPAVLLLAPAVAEASLLTVAVLVALAVIADRHDVPMPSGIRFDAMIALALISLAIAGPRATLLVVYAPMLVNGLTGHERLWRAGNLANFAAYSGYTLAGAFALAALPMAPTAAAALPWLVAIGFGLLLLNWLVGPALYGSLWLGRPMRVLWQILPDTIPAGGVMLGLGALAIVATPAAGLAALAGFALIAVLPQSALTFAMRTEPVSRLGRVEATRSYAGALAVQLRLSRTERRHLLAVAERLQRRPASGEPLDYAIAMLRDPTDTQVAAAELVHEHWDGTGKPIGLRGTLIPLSSRVVAVAQAWSELTASGTAGLSHAAALEAMELRAGTELDPAIVEAARAVVAQECVSLTEPSPQPRLHRLRVPAPLRRVLASVSL